MLVPAVKSGIRIFLGMVYRDSVPVLSGPLRGSRLLRHHGLVSLSMLFGTYESDFSNAFLSHISGCRTVYDVGAHAGYFSLLAARHLNAGSSVHAFEPAPDVAEDCRRLVGLNRLENSIVVNEMAISDTCGTLRLVTPASSTTGIIETAARHRRIAEEGAVQVQTQTLDWYVFEQNNAPPDLIKVDVEGAEALVLNGARRLLSEHRPLVLMEVHGREPASAVWDVCTELGYQIALIGQGRSETLEQEEWVSRFRNSRWKIEHCLLSPREKKRLAA